MATILKTSFATTPGVVLMTRAPRRSYRRHWPPGSRGVPLPERSSRRHGQDPGQSRVPGRGQKSDRDPSWSRERRSDRRSYGFRTGLVAFVVPEPSLELDARELRLCLQRQLPSYMVPELVCLRDSLPRTASGKPDRVTLAAQAVELLSEPIPRRNRAESEINMEQRRQLLGEIASRHGTPTFVYFMDDAEGARRGPPQAFPGHVRRQLCDEVQSSSGSGLAHRTLGRHARRVLRRRAPDRVVDRLSGTARSALPVRPRAAAISSWRSSTASVRSWSSPCARRAS